MSENAKIETGSNADPKAPGDPSGESVLGAPPPIKDCPKCGHEMTLAAALEIDADTCVICWMADAEDGSNYFKRHLRIITPMTKNTPKQATPCTINGEPGLRLWLDRGRDRRTGEWRLRMPAGDDEPDMDEEGSVWLSQEVIDELFGNSE